MNKKSYLKNTRSAGKSVFCICECAKSPHVGTEAMLHGREMGRRNSTYEEP